MKIAKAEVFVHSPGRNFVTLRITTDDGLVGLGDATVNGRELAVAAYLRDHLAPMLIGRDAHNIEDTWQYFYRGSLPTTTGIGSSYRVSNTVVGAALLAGNSASYQSLSTEKKYQLSQSPGGPGTYLEKQAQLTIRIAASGNDAPLAVGYAALYVYVDRT